MIGNDVVDLAVAKKQLQRKGFRENFTKKNNYLLLLP
jgi:hypothetical protein